MAAILSGGACAAVCAVVALVLRWADPSAAAFVVICVAVATGVMWPSVGVSRTTVAGRVIAGASGVIMGLLTLLVPGAHVGFLAIPAALLASFIFMLVVRVGRLNTTIQTTATVSGAFVACGVASWLVMATDGAVGSRYAAAAALTAMLAVVPFFGPLRNIVRIGVATVIGAIGLPSLLDLLGGSPAPVWLGCMCGAILGAGLSASLSLLVDVCEIVGRVRTTATIAAGLASAGVAGALASTTCIIMVA